MSLLSAKARVRWASLALVGLFATPAVVPAADHMDSPRTKMFTFLDINDVYLFQSPVHPQNTVIIVTVVPMAGLVNPAIFSPIGDYELKIDNTGDAIEDITYRFSFTFPNKQGVQRMVVQKYLGVNGAPQIVGQALTGPKALKLKDGAVLTASYFDDPFFFDLNAFNRFKISHNPNEFCNPGVNFFKNLNVMAMVMEVPSTKLIQHFPGANQPALPIGVWARTFVNGIQFDRMGRPAVNTALIPNELKDAFNSGIPMTDRFNFMDTVAGTLNEFNNPPETVMSLTQLLLPDVNTFDTTSTMGFPNGRQLLNDVIDDEFTLFYKNIGLTTDCVNNDSTFLDHYPYLGKANKYPKPGKGM